MTMRATYFLKRCWNVTVYVQRWIVALFRVVLRLWWRTKVALFNAPTQGNFDEFEKLYRNYHRSMVHLLVGDIDAALQDPPPPYPRGWGF
jgi:hypothetical protein